MYNISTNGYRQLTIVCSDAFSYRWLAAARHSSCQTRQYIPFPCHAVLVNECAGRVDSCAGEREREEQPSKENREGKENDKKIRLPTLFV